MSPLEITIRSAKTRFIYKSIFEFLISNGATHYLKLQEEIVEALKNNKFAGKSERIDFHLARLRDTYGAVENIGAGNWQIKWPGAINLLDFFGLRSHLPVVVVGCNFNKTRVREMLRQKSIEPKSMIDLDDESLPRNPIEIRDKIISEIEKILPGHNINIELTGGSYKEVMIGLQLVAQTYSLRQMIGGKFL